jgi:3'-phosphoadenosine 5'-phosphosulfate (PAPS) 3'-phosphatase
VALATAFVKEGVAGLSTVAPSMTKAERAAEKARLKADKAAQKAEEARIKVEEEKDAKKNEAELKRKRKEEKILKRLQVGEMGLYGTSGMVSLMLH